jgi:putative tryptophan/tyrosine transport system substrate-binding protein
MRRRDFITGITGAAAAWPLAARAQQAATPVVGYLGTGSSGAGQELVSAFHRGLKEAGYIEGQNVRIEYRWAEGQYQRLPTLAVELVQRRPTVIVTTGGSRAALAAEAATTKIPIIFSAGDDPIETGIVSSLNRPNGNVTGATFLTTVLEAKRLELLHELVPSVSVIALLVNPSAGEAKAQAQQAQEAADRLGVKLIVLDAASEDAIDASFDTMIRERVGAVVVASTAFFFSRRKQLIVLAARHAIPAIYQLREFTTDGGLMSYGASATTTYHQVGIYTGRVLNGERPADLPVVQPSKFELVINLRTAKALGVTVSNAMQLLADEVIE